MMCCGLGRCTGRRLSSHTVLNPPRLPAQIYQSEAKLVVDPKTVQITRGHFLAAMRALIPSSHRAASPYARAAPAHVMPLLKVSRARRTRGWLMQCSVHHYHPFAPKFGLLG
jgi:hypothetical protein